MEKQAKIAALVVGAVGLAVGVPYLLKMKRLSEELETVTTANIHKVGLSGIDLRVDVVLKNPTGGSLRVKYPFVRMLYKGVVFATSEVRDQNFEVPKFGQLTMEPIYINIPFLQLATKAPDMLKEYRKNGGFEMEVRTVTTINDKIPYSKTDKLSV